jgi:hypothetical protein
MNVIYAHVVVIQAQRKMLPLYILTAVIISGYVIFILAGCGRRSLRSLRF